MTQQNDDDIPPPDRAHQTDPPPLDELIARRYGAGHALPDAGVASLPAGSDETVLRQLLNRRSRRAFRADPVPPALLDTLFAAAFSAPSKSDLQQACVIVVDDRETQRRIAAGSAKVRWVADAPLFMVWCGDSRRIRRVCAHRGHPFANDHLDAFMNAAVDVGIALQAFITAAESVGLGCCPVSEIRDRIAQLSEALALPEHVFPVAGLCVGWPAGPGRLSMRLPPAVTVHRNRYDDSALLAEVDAYDRRREALDRTAPGQQRLVERYGVCNDYGWAENRARQYAQPMRDDFGAYIRRQGFDLT